MAHLGSWLQIGGGRVFGLFVPMACGVIGPTLKRCWRGAIVFLFGWDVDVVCQRMMILRALVPSICSM